MKIYVDRWVGCTFILEVEPWQLVASVKNKIEDQEGNKINLNFTSFLLF